MVFVLVFLKLKGVTFNKNLVFLSKTCMTGHDDKAPVETGTAGNLIDARRSIGAFDFKDCSFSGYFGIRWISNDIYYMYSDI